MPVSPRIAEQGKFFDRGATKTSTGLRSPVMYSEPFEDGLARGQRMGEILQVMEVDPDFAG